MASNYMTLGQSNPSAATITTLYTVPASTNAVTSTILVCNRAAIDTTFRIAVRPAGAGISDEHYIYYDVPAPANDTFAATIGIALEATDVVSVYATLATLGFSVFGSEVT